ncbi:hypothetical protein FQR65_LT04025 [Abscondita terminalis]|nr:hypothetical protein FQR65_LT04025 [Abscondita terminalis]
MTSRLGRLKGAARGSTIVNALINFQRFTCCDLQASGAYKRKLNKNKEEAHLETINKNQKLDNFFKTIPISIDNPPVVELRSMYDFEPDLNTPSTSIAGVDQRSYDNNKHEPTPRDTSNIEEEIDVITNFVVATVKARFKALREKYRRELQIEERLRRSGAPASTRPAWNLMSFFKFMNSRDDSRETISNYANETSTVENSVDYTSETLNDHNYYSEVEIHEDLHIPTSSAAVVESSQPKKRKNSHNGSDDIDNVLKDITDAIRGVNENVTKYDQFSLYLATELKSLSANNADLLMDHLMMELLKFKAKVRQS